MSKTTDQTRNESKMDNDDDPTENAGFELWRKLEFEDEKFEVYSNLRGLIKLSDYQLERVVDIIRDKR